MRTFVLGDIHGNYPALVQCLERSGFDKKKDRLIQLGDVVDGKPFSFECVEELLGIDNLIAIRGNHDNWFQEFLQTGYHPVSWDFGGRATVQSYLQRTGRAHLIRKARQGFKTALDARDIPVLHKKFFDSQIHYFIDERNNCFVHGGFDRNNLLEGQPPLKYMWDRELWFEAIEQLVENLTAPEPRPFYCKSGFNNIFIGHTQTLHWKTDRPMKAFNIYNLDTGAGGRGRLTIMNVDTKEWFQSDAQPL